MEGDIPQVLQRAASPVLIRIKAVDHAHFAGGPTRGCTPTSPLHTPTPLPQAWARCLVWWRSPPTSAGSWWCCALGPLASTICWSTPCGGCSRPRSRPPRATWCTASASSSWACCLRPPVGQARPSRSRRSLCCAHDFGLASWLTMCFIVTAKPCHCIN